MNAGARHQHEQSGPRACHGCRAPAQRNAGTRPAADDSRLPHQSTDWLLPRQVSHCPPQSTLSYSCGSRPGSRCLPHVSRGHVDLAVLEGASPVTRRPVSSGVSLHADHLHGRVRPGVVLGLVMSCEFGTNWAGLAHRVGPIVGPLMGYEVLTPSSSIRLSRRDAVRNNRVGPTLHTGRLTLLSCRLVEHCLSSVTIVLRDSPAPHASCCFFWSARPSPFRWFSATPCTRILSGRRTTRRCGEASHGLSVYGAPRVSHGGPVEVCSERGDAWTGTARPVLPARITSARYDLLMSATLGGAVKHSDTAPAPACNYMS